jgi:hypothetical protein
VNSTRSGPSAFIADPEMTDCDDWYMDSGASNHVTNNVNKFHQRTTYDGKEKLTVGNGKISKSHILEIQI